MLLNELVFTHRFGKHSAASIQRKNRVIEVWIVDDGSRYDIYSRPPNKSYGDERWRNLGPLETQAILFSLLEKYPEK